MKIGKNYIRNYITKQLLTFNNYYGVDRVDVYIRGKVLGYACKDNISDIDRTCYWMWASEGDISKSLREACKTLRANIRFFVRETTNNIYALGLEHDENDYVTDHIIGDALDEEIADYCDASYSMLRNARSVDYRNLTNEI